MGLLTSTPPSTCPFPREVTAAHLPPLLEVDQSPLQSRQPASIRRSPSSHDHPSPLLRLRYPEQTPRGQPQHSWTWVGSGQCPDSGSGDSWKTEAQGRRTRLHPVPHWRAQPLSTHSRLREGCSLFPLAAPSPPAGTKLWSPIAKKGRRCLPVQGRLGALVRTRSTPSAESAGPRTPSPAPGRTHIQIVLHGRVQHH